MVSELSPSEKNKTTKSETPAELEKRQEAYNSENEALLKKYGFELAAQAVIVLGNGKSVALPSGMIAARPLLQNRSNTTPQQENKPPEEEIAS